MKAAVTDEHEDKPLFHGELHAQRVTQTHSQSSGDASDIRHRLGPGNHVLNQSAVHGCFLDDDSVGGNGFVERLAEPAGIHRDLIAMRYCLTLKARHLLVMLFLDFMEPRLVGCPTGDKSFRCLESANDAFQRHCRRSNQGQIDFVAPEGKTGVRIFVAEENNLGICFGAFVYGIPGSHGVGDQHQVGGLDAARIIGKI